MKTTQTTTSGWILRIRAEAGNDFVNGCIRNYRQNGIALTKA